MREGGYTLVEILVVILIISIITSVGLLSIRHNDNKRLETYANELTQMLTLAEEQAMLQPSILSLRVNDRSLYFAQLQFAANHSTWVQLTDRALGEHAIPQDIELRLDVKQTENPQVVISTNGDVTPFTLYIGMKGQKPRYAVIGDADGSITNKLLS